MADSRLIAVAVEDGAGLDGEVSHHFGRCPGYAMVEVVDGAVGQAKHVPNPFFNAHRPGVVPKFIADQGADVILAGGMGPRAVSMFQSYGIEVATGAIGNVRKVIEAYMRGEVRGIVPCQHDHPESCGGHD